MRKILLVFFTFCILSVQSNAQQISVEVFEFGTGVEDRQLAGADSVFAPTIERVYCFTQIDGMGDNTTITHVWYYNEEERARVELPINGDNWRTWSSKYILENWTGQWSVDVLSNAGEVLATKSFRIGQQVANQ